MTTKSLEEVDQVEEVAATPLGALSWIEELRRVSVAVSHKPARVASHRNQLFYFLHWSEKGDAFGVSVRRGRDPESSEEWWALDRSFDKTPGFATDEDMEILKQLWAQRNHTNGLRAFTLTEVEAGSLMRAMLDSGRLCSAVDLSPLLVGEERLGKKHTVEIKGHVFTKWVAEPEASVVIPGEPAWYVDLEEGVAGTLSVEMPASLDTCLDAEPVVRTISRGVIGELKLQTLEIHGHKAWRQYVDDEGASYFDVCIPKFRYEDAEIAIDDASEVFALADGEFVSVVRDSEREKSLLAALERLGFERVPHDVLYTAGSPPATLLGLEHEAHWASLMQAGVEALREAGWEVLFDDDFRHHALDIDAWDAELHAATDGWFDLDMGIIVEGNRLPLAPLLATLFRQDTRWLDSFELRNIPDDEVVELRTESNVRIRASAARLKPLALTLIDLFDGFDGKEMLRVSKFDAQRLTELNDTRRWQFRGQSDVFALAERLQTAQGIKDVTLPSGLGLDLRPYQREGVAWLQFLREQSLAGILADDMGLGKTAQALAHLLIEKQAGRLDLPTLIILPTSLIFNWRNEAARFAPELKVLSLHGPERKSRYAEIPEHDIVLTTYSLLWRDAAELSEYQYHLLILDEAQTVKNVRSRGAEVIRKLDARHRLCLTGTPLENHLGELWSQFDFLLPGFLGGRNAFTKFWRNPIEKEDDRERRDLLARRIRPFVLRRKKEEVALELPPKTVIVRKVELAGSQRDLYEAVRAAMDVMVRDEIASKGFGRSQIVILDALLKLRQVCCDPRLVKSIAAQKVKERAKLELLMTMVPEQVEEGRKILIFSQFTSMLALIAAELKKTNIDYVILSGDTPDRETPVSRFQNGEVPVFLISLKAGGVGLNLTAADTVIHYDPWWNPAVENQATDRAHRIGQAKPVFVYKLIVAGSIEEKILSLQERKASLAEGILSNEGNALVKFGEDDIASLFEPLPS